MNNNYTITSISEFALNYEKIDERVSNKIIAIDVDGTIAKTVELFIAILNKEHNTTISINDIFAWDTYFSNIKKGTRDIEDYFSINKEFLESIKPYEHSVEIINFIMDVMNPFEVKFVTDRPSQFDDNTMKWLNNLGFLEYPVVLENTRAKGKQNVITHILIDDKFDSAYGFACKTPGNLSIIPIRPWNKMYHTREVMNSLEKEKINVLWFDFWEEVPGLIFNYYLNTEENNE